MVPTLAREDLEQRRYDLDWLRIAVFLLLILYHVGMYYVSWDWHVKSPHASRAIEPLMLLTSPWRLSLLFLISGVATSYLLERRGSRGFLGQRSVRLLIPLVFGSSSSCRRRPTSRSSRRCSTPAATLSFSASI
jgi:peptidoglycan/LPS O-acetylase OafA/YrhL